LCVCERERQREREEFVLFFRIEHRVQTDNKIRQNKECLYAPESGRDRKEWIGKRENN